MDPASLALAERSAPRYTSYPTAPHFSKAIGDAEMRAWLAALDADASLSLYFHVPFCTAICAYCGCHTKAVRQEAPLADYAKTLLREIALMARATRAAARDEHPLGRRHAEHSRAGALDADRRAPARLF